MTSRFYKSDIIIFLQVVPRPYSMFSQISPHRNKQQVGEIGMSHFFSFLMEGKNITEVKFIWILSW